MEQREFIRFARRLQLLFVLLPAAALTCFYAFVFRARVTLGYWPSYNNPDPKQLGFDLHHSLVWLFLMTLPITAIVAVIYSITALVVPRKLSLWRALLPVIISFGLGFAVIGIDPGGFFSWFAD